jgi:hypothetical protein
MKRIINQQRGTRNISNFLCSVFLNNFIVFSTKVNSSTMKRIINQQRGTRNTEHRTQNAELFKLSNSFPAT